MFENDDTVGSPKSDSLDYDDELAELHEYRERFLRNNPDKDLINNDLSDEDTEDASEDGYVRGGQEECTEIKEQAYYEKLNVLKSLLKQLENTTHPDYKKKIIKIDKAYKERLKLNESWREYEAECIDKDFLNEKRAAYREFEDKKIELRENLISEHEEKKKQIESERHSLELNADPTEVKQVSTRKLRRRPNDPAPIQEKRRKTPQSQLTFLLDEREIDDDLRYINKGKGFSPQKKHNFNSSLMSLSSNNDIKPSIDSDICSSSSSLSTDIRIEDGKLFFEKRWFHRGQPVYIEGKEILRTSGVISAISLDTIWVRKLGDQTKFRILLTHLIKGKCSIKRRA